MVHLVAKVLSIVILMYQSSKTSWKRKIAQYLNLGDEV